MNPAPAYADPAKLTEATFARYYDLMLALKVRGAMLDRMQQTILKHPEPFLKMIMAPTVLVWGEKDAVIPISNAAAYSESLPASQRISKPRLGHLPYEEMPSTSLLPVQNFLRQ
jgi:pimeloyl-ACP methyl ester carboxylesterase